MSKIKLEIVFYDYWHCSSGLSGGSRADSVVAKDKDGLPYIPGKTLKGHLREAAELLYKDEPNFIDNCFGKEAKEGDENRDRKEGECYFSNAIIKDEIDKSLAPYLYHTIASTKIGKKGLAETGSLREIEVVVPLTLTATISNCSDVEKLEEVVKVVKHIGLNRNRGLGRCDICIDKCDKKEEHTK